MEAVQSMHDELQMQGERWWSQATDWVPSPVGWMLGSFHAKRGAGYCAWECFRACEKAGIMEVCAWILWPFGLLWELACVLILWLAFQLRRMPHRS